MKARASAAVLLVSLGTAAAVAVTRSSADEQIRLGAPATIYRTIVETTVMSYQGHGPRWWARRAVVARRAAHSRLRAVRHLQAANRARLTIGATGLERAFMCIHSYEGSWRDPDAPYFGGLQMDRDFMAAYGRPFLDALGTADNWPPAVQLTVGMAAYYSGRRFEPWPNTARACGLR